MNLHEYQAKQLLTEYGLPVPKGYVVESVEEALVAVNKINSETWIAKAQVHAGGRGKADGIKIISNKEELANFVKKMIGSRLVTSETHNHGQLVSKILIESYINIIKELYLSIFIDQSKSCITFIASTQGSFQNEDILKKNPKKTLKEVIDPIIGEQPYQARNIAFKLGLKDNQTDQFIKIFLGLIRLFRERDLELLKIDPLSITNEGNLYCLDIKVIIDVNASYRQPRLMEWRDVLQEDEHEARAIEHKFNYVALEAGNIGCIANSAGLAMATMDVIKLYCGKPGNFLDIGEDISTERLLEAVKIILSNVSVKGMFINAFGSTTGCDLIAQNIIAVAEEVSFQVPIVVYFSGINSNLGKKILCDSALSNIITASNFVEGVKKIIRLVEEEPTI